MAHYEQAPMLYFNGSKTQDNTTNQTYQIPQKLADIIFNTLGNASAQLRIMLVLCGTKEGFSISEKWILERTGLQHASYINARKSLVEKGWLTLINSQKLIVNYDIIYGNTILPQESNTILPQESNTILPKNSNTTLPIINNRIYKQIDDKNNRSKREPFVF